MSLFKSLCPEEDRALRSNLVGVSTQQNKELLWGRSALDHVLPNYEAALKTEHNEKYISLFFPPVHFSSKVASFFFTASNFTRYSFHFPKRAGKKNNSLSCKLTILFFHLSFLMQNIQITWRKRGYCWTVQSKSYFLFHTAHHRHGPHEPATTALPPRPTGNSSSGFVRTEPKFWETSQ